MRAAVLSPDGTPQLQDLEPPPSGGEGAQVEVLAAGVNPIDLLTAAARAAAPQPQVAGREGVGLLDGRRVYFAASVAPYGSFAEYDLAAPDVVVELPDAVDDGLAIAIGIAGQAAWLGLEWRARLAPGEHVLVLGAGGVVGMVGVQAARVLGAGRVVAAARTEAGLEFARDQGADAVVRIDPERPRAELAAALREAGAGRIDVVVDPLWGEPGLAALEAASAGARHIQIGGSAGREVEFNPAPLRRTMIDLMPFSAGVPPPEVRRAGYAAALAAAAAGEIVVPVRELPLEDVAAAWESQRSGAGGKLVLRVR